MIDITLKNLTPQQIEKITGFMQTEDWIIMGDEDRDHAASVETVDAGAAFASTTAPVTEPATTAPVTEPATTAPVVTAAVELDKNGLPWCEEIHSKGKSQNADGTWRYKKGVDRAIVVPQVEARLRAELAAGAPPVTETPAAAPPAPVTETPAAAPPAPVTEPSAAVAGTITTFDAFLPKLSAAKASGTVTDEKLAEVCTALGIVNIGQVATEPALIPQAVELLGLS